MAEVKERRIELRASPFCCELALGVGGSTCKASDDVLCIVLSFIYHLLSLLGRSAHEEIEVFEMSGPSTRRNSPVLDKSEKS